MLAQEISHSTPPTLIYETDPEYTEEALAARPEGTVIFSLMVGVDGIPPEIKVTWGLGMGLDEKATECLERWRLKPTTRVSEPIPAKATVEINFRLPKPAR